MTTVLKRETRRPARGDCWHQRDFTMQPKTPLHSSFTRKPRRCSVRVARSIRNPMTLGTTTLAVWPAGFKLPLIEPAATAVEVSSSATAAPTISLFTRFPSSSKSRQRESSPSTPEPVPNRRSRYRRRRRSVADWV